MSFYGDNIQSSLTSTLFGPGAIATSINAFKAKFSDGGARANMFSVTLPFPSWVSYGLDSSTQMQFLCKATALPSTSITTNPVVYRGRTINIAAERTFQPWTVTIYNSTQMQFLCKATALPSTSITTNPVVYRGRTINIAAERTFQPWTVTIYNS